MSLKRRELLLFTLTLGGLGVATLVRQSLSQINSSKNPTNSTIKESSSTTTKVPAKGDVRIIVISDLNSRYGSTTYEEQVERAIALIPGWKPDLVLCAGDMVAGQKRSLSTDQINAMWQAFDRAIYTPLKQAEIPFAFTVGNHDGSSARVKGEQVFAGERELASNYWKKQALGLEFVHETDFPFNYTFQQRGIFYLVFDASSYFISPEQLEWIAQTLKSQEARSAKMRIAIAHLPLYPVAIGRNKVGDYVADGDKVRSLLEKYRVHTYISGHHHAYYPGKRGKLELLHAGALGSGPRQLINTKIPPRNTVTIVDINLDSALTRYTTYDLKTMKAIAIQSLPKLVSWEKNWVLRRDLELEMLNPEERSSLN